MVGGFAPGTFHLLWCLRKGSKGRMIELFKQPNIDWMGKAKYFYALSGILLLAGWVSILYGSGIRYGIDFKGGTNVDVRFAQPPNVDKLRSSLAAQGLGNTEIQSIKDIGDPNSNEVVIFVEGKGQDEQALEEGRVRVLGALNAAYGLSGSNKPNFNAATTSSLAALLSEKDPLLLSVNAGDRYQQLAKKILDYRDKNAHGVLTNFDDLSKADGVTAPVLAALKDSYVLGPFGIRNVEVVGPKVGAELRQQAIYVTLYALGGMLVYIAFRFQGGGSVGQVLRAFSFALVVGIVVGTYSSFGIAAPLVVAWNRWRGQGVAAGTGPAAGNKTRSSENVPGRLATAGRR